jgi:hypothetical protein
MRLPALLLVPLLAGGVALATSGCTFVRQPPPPAPVAPPKPVSGWTSELSTSAAGALVEALTNDGWVTRFRETNGRLPVVEVTPFADRSADHVPVEQVASEFSRLLGASDRVLAATAGQVADVSLSGVIGLKGSEYTIDARISDKRTADTLWVAGITRAKP